MLLQENSVRGGRAQCTGEGVRSVKAAFAVRENVITLVT